MKTDNVAKPVSVLVVEDEWLIQMDIVAALEAAGFTVDAAGSNSSALKLLETHDFAVAVLDGWLDKAWSEPVARALELRHIPYILCSAFRLHEMPWAKPTLHIHKPISFDVLVHEVRRLAMKMHR